MKNRTHFKNRIDMLDKDGEVVEHLAGVEDFLLADTVYEAAVKRWPKERIMMRQEARIIHDSSRPRLMK